MSSSKTLRSCDSRSMLVPDPLTLLNVLTWRGFVLRRLIRSSIVSRACAMLIALPPTVRMFARGIKVDCISFEETLCALCAPAVIKISHGGSEKDAEKTNLLEETSVNPVPLW